MDRRPADTDATDRNAALTVIDVTELLEHVLLNLDLTTLLLAQRVSRRFHEIIMDSLKLQKKLFFAPVATFEEAEALGMVRQEDFITFTYPRDVSNSTPLAVINPNIIDFPEGSTDDFSQRPRILEDIRSSRRGRSSWQRMCVMQPPTRKDSFKVYRVGKLRDIKDKSDDMLMESHWTRSKHAAPKKLCMMMDEVETALGDFYPRSDYLAHGQRLKANQKHSFRRIEDIEFEEDHKGKVAYREHDEPEVKDAVKDR